MKPFKLRRGQLCHVHKSFFCCGRQNAPMHYLAGRALQQYRRDKAPSLLRWQPITRGVWRIKDEHHPRGFREKRDKKAMQRLLNEKILAQDNRCALCRKEFDDYSQIVAEHKEPKGMGSARRDDHPDNIQAAHSYPCNCEKGSKRIA